MTRILTVSDTFDFKQSSRIYLDNGFLRVSGKAARTGVYQYIAKELGLTDRNPADIVNVYRPEEEVFNDASIQSYYNVDVTNDHPKSMVDAESFRTTSVGHVVSAKQDGDFVDVDLIVKDQKAIKDIETGKTQLSPGYTAVYVEEKGVAPSGENYDFKQTAIDVNHVAIVARGRGGMQVKLNDHDKGDKAMTTITLDSGRTVDVEDGAAATLILDSIERLNKGVTDAKNESETKQAVIDSLTDEVKNLKTLTSDDAINARVSLIASTIDSARKKAGQDFTCDSTDVVTIQRAALAKIKPNFDWAGKSDTYVAAAFDMAEEKSDEDEDEEGVLDVGGRGKERIKKANDADPYKALTNDGKQPQEVKVSAYDAHKASLSGAWKGKEK